MCSLMQLDKLFHQLMQFISRKFAQLQSMLSGYSFFNKNIFGKLRCLIQHYTNFRLNYTSPLNLPLLKMKKNLWILFLLFCELSHAQKQGVNWCFGDSAGISFINLASPQTYTTSTVSRGSCCSISDTVGNLLFYANTAYSSVQGPKYGVVWNKYNQVMINGDSLIGNSWFREMVILPMPGNDSLYFLFQVSVTLGDGLFYSIIEPNYLNGTGRVLAKNIRINLPDNDIADASCAIRHANGRDWWYFVHNWHGGNAFYILLITPSGISGPFVTSIGSNSTYDTFCLNPSKKGDKLAVSNYGGLLEVLSFDRCTGLISNPINILPESVTHPPFSGCEFSPNGNVLYVSSTDNIFGDSLRLYQYDLTAPNIRTSEQIIYCQQVPASGGLLKLGPDDKIYWATLYTSGFPYPDSIRNIYNENLSVIRQPDSLGLACDFHPFDFYLGGNRCYWGLPNNPNYNLGPVDFSICDSITTDIPNASIQENNFELFPNPCEQVINISYPDGIERLEIFNAMGELELSIYHDFQMVSTKSLRNGIYFMRIFTRNNALVKRFVVQH